MEAEYSCCNHAVFIGRSRDLGDMWMCSSLSYGKQWYHLQGGNRIKCSSSSLENVDWRDLLEVFQTVDCHCWSWWRVTQKQDGILAKTRKCFWSAFWDLALENLRQPAMILIDCWRIRAWGVGIKSPYAYAFLLQELGPVAQASPNFNEEPSSCSILYCTESSPVDRNGILKTAFASLQKIYKNSNDYYGGKLNSLQNTDNI